jgi:curli biogenesis system outer membrane secretion channel CsgG
VCIALALIWGGAAGPASAGDAPKIAVLDFNTKGLTATWYGQFQPGVALADLLTDQLVNSGKFRVLDRQSIEQVMQEHKLSETGEVSSTKAVESGRLFGARYLITGNVLQLDKTGESGGVGAIVGAMTGGLLSGGRSERVTLKVQVRVIDAVTGEIVQSFADEQTKKGSSWGIAGIGVGAGGAYGNSQFVNSTMGHLINDEAARILDKIDPDKLVSTIPTVTKVSGRVILNDGGSIVINVGSARGVAVGMMFDVFRVRLIKDPDTGKMISARVPIGRLEVISVSEDSAVGHLKSGTADASSVVEGSR